MWGLRRAGKNLGYWDKEGKIDNVKVTIKKNRKYQGKEEKIMDTGVRRGNLRMSG